MTYEETLMPLIVYIRTHKEQEYMQIKMEEDEWERLSNLLEKQIPMKPISDYRFRLKKCPHCHDFLENYQSFCDNCGQRIDWSDEDE